MSDDNGAWLEASPWQPLRWVYQKIGVSKEYVHTALGNFNLQRSQVSKIGMICFNACV